MALPQNWRVSKDAAPPTFWDRLEEASRDLGLPSGLSDIARELDIWPSAVQKWRDGVNYPAKKNIITLARNRGVNVEWLETGRGPKLAEGEMDAATRELLAIWLKLPEEAQARLLHAARYERTATSVPPASPPTDAPHHPGARKPTSR